MATVQVNRKGCVVAENLRQKLAMAVKSIQWSYAIFWSISATEPGLLEWCDGYYNGDIKTRKTVQAVELKDDDEVGLQRTEQLRELYESLSAAAETSSHEPLVNAIRRPSAALSPEDLTDTEWYFLVCMSFEFTNGQGLPGRTLAKNTIIWLCNAYLADSKVFSRSLLAKSASIQTVICFPYLGGVVEFGTTVKVLEDHNIIKQIKASILEAPSQNILKIPNNSLENCTTMLDHDLVDNNFDAMLECGQGLVRKTCNSARNSSNGVPYQNRQREDSVVVEDIYIGGSQVQSWQFIDGGGEEEEEEEEGEVSFFHNNSMGSSDCISHNLVSGRKYPSFDFQSDGDSNYQGILYTIFNSNRRLILGPHFRSHNVKESSFISWKNGGGMELNGFQAFRGGDSSQVLLKKALYEVPKMHGNFLVATHKENGNQGRPWKPEADDGNNALLERKRREKINQKFSVLGSLVPSTGKADKVSLLDDTIAYLKALERRVEELESNELAGDREVMRTRKKSHDMAERTSDNYGDHKTLLNKRKASCDLEDLQEDSSSDCITVSIVEKNVSIEIRCQWKENLMLQVLDTVSNLHLDSHSVRSSIVDGILSLSIESKLKGCTMATAKMIRLALQKVIAKA